MPRARGCDGPQLHLGSCVKDETAHAIRVQSIRVGVESARIVAATWHYAACYAGRAYLSHVAQDDELASTMVAALHQSRALLLL